MSANCISCPDPPECPKCGPKEVCIQTSQTCTTCPQTFCRSKATSHGASSKTVGGIAGGIIGGLVVLFSVAGYLFYRYYWKNRAQLRQQMREKQLQEEKEAQAQMFALASISNGGVAGSRISNITTGTRASNIIPIAYIPGVTAALPGQRMRPDSSVTIDTDTIMSAGSVGHAVKASASTRAMPKLVQIEEEEDEKRMSIIAERRQSMLAEKRRSAVLREEVKRRSAMSSSPSMYSSPKDSATNLTMDPFILEEEEEEDDSYLLDVDLGGHDSPFEDAFKITKE